MTLKPSAKKMYQNVKKVLDLMSYNFLIVSARFDAKHFIILSAIFDVIHFLIVSIGSWNGF